MPPHEQDTTSNGIVDANGAINKESGVADETHLNNGTALSTALPDPEGYFGQGDQQYGGAFLPPPLVPVMKEVDQEYQKIKTDPEFLAELGDLRKRFIGRPSPIYECKNLSKKLGGATIYLKREDLNHTGSHKINHCLGEALLAKKMGKTKLIAETGAGQHGVALCTAASLMQMECEIHMGEIDIKKEWPNVRRMQVLGGTVIPATTGGKSLKEAVDSACKYRMRRNRALVPESLTEVFCLAPCCLLAFTVGAYMSNTDEMFFAIGSTVGPHPFPMMVRDFQAIVGFEAKEQFKELSSGGKPDMCLACVGGGCNSLGLFTAFLDDPDVQLVGVEPAGHGLDKGEGHHSATLTLGQPSVLHGMKTYTLINANGDAARVHSCASGLDYPGVGPQHSFMKDLGRVKYETATDEEVINAFFELSRMEGIIPALESAHALAYAMKIAPTLSKDKKLLVNMSGRGDKDLDYVCNVYGGKFGIGKEGIFAGPPTHDN
jgi:tryptophan synthase beta chain